MLQPFFISEYKLVISQVPSLLLHPHITKRYYNRAYTNYQQQSHFIFSKLIICNIISKWI